MPTLIKVFLMNLCSVIIILQNAFGDLYIPEDFEPPTIQKISQLSRRSHDVGSESIEILDAKTLRIPELNYNGAGKGLDDECGSWRVHDERLLLFISCCKNFQMPTFMLVLGRSHLQREIEFLMNMASKCAFENKIWKKVIFIVVNTSSTSTVKFPAWIQFEPTKRKQLPWNYQEISQYLTLIGLVSTMLNRKKTMDQSLFLTVWMCPLL